MMSIVSSTRKWCAVLLLASTGTIGCSRKAFQPVPETISQAPIKEDGAMARRQWDQTTVVYPSGITPAFSTGFLREPKPGLQEWTYVLISPTMFLLQSARLPTALVRDRAWRPRNYYAALVPPTNSAMPEQAKNEIIWDPPVEQTGPLGPTDNNDSTP